MKLRQNPQIRRTLVHPHLNQLPQRIQIRPPVLVLHPFRHPRCPRSVADTDTITFRFEVEAGVGVPRVRGTRGQEGFVGAGCGITIVTDHDNFLKVRNLNFGVGLRGRVGQGLEGRSEFVVDEEEFGFGVVEDVGDFGGFEAGVDLFERMGDLNCCSLSYCWFGG